MLPRSRRGAVFHGPGRPPTIEAFPEPSLPGGDVLVHIRLATVCASDLHSDFGRREAPSPGILGHEMVGEVVATGPEGACDHEGVPLQPRVAVVPQRSG